MHLGGVLTHAVQHVNCPRIACIFITPPSPQKSSPTHLSTGQEMVGKKIQDQGKVREN